MACSHLNAKAYNEIELLNNELENYNAFISEVEAVQATLESYASFLSSLGSLLEDVRLTGYPYDNGKCESNAKKLRDLKDGDLEAMKSSANTAILEINIDIKKQRTIINSTSECTTCKNARLNAAAQTSGKGTTVGGPRVNFAVTAIK